MPPQLTSPAAAARAASGPDLAVTPELLRAAASRLRAAADSLPAAGLRLGTALGAAAVVAARARSGVPLREHAAVTGAAVTALAEQVLALARALEAAAMSYRAADVDAGRPFIGSASSRWPL